MGVTKTEIFTESQNKFAKIAKALGHPARVAILQHILKVNRCICGDLVTEIGLAQPTISQHLKELKNAGFIKGTIEGTSVCYCIDTKHWQYTKKMCNDLFEALTNQNHSDENCC